MEILLHVSLLGLYGVWTRFPSTFIVGMFWKHGTYVVLKKSKMWKCGVESSKTRILGHKIISSFQNNMLTKVCIEVGVVN